MMGRISEILNESLIAYFSSKHKVIKFDQNLIDWKILLTFVKTEKFYIRHSFEILLKTFKR